MWPFENPKSTYLHLLQVSTTYEQWFSAAERLDVIDKATIWKNNPTCPDYDHVLISDRLAQFKRARLANDYVAMLFLLHTSLSRNIGNICNKELFKHCRVGTKQIVEDFIEEVCIILELISEASEEHISHVDKINFYKKAQRSFGRTALLLSGGAV